MYISYFNILRSENIELVFAVLRLAWIFLFRGNIHFDLHLLRFNLLMNVRNYQQPRESPINLKKKQSISLAIRSGFILTSLSNKDSQPFGRRMGFEL